jgi:phospholipid N-methyltransferase
MLSKAVKLQETSAFIVEWIKSPLVTASVIPSSTRLAKKMVQGLDPLSELVIELGPGTGVFTNQLLAAGIKEESLVLVELNHTFADKLRKKYPAATIINGAAEALPRLQLKKANAVVSGLPLLSMRDKQIDLIVGGVFEVMQPGGVLIQFTYGHRCPIKKSILQQHGLVAQRNSFVLNNFPPASVYHISKRLHQHSV